MEKMTNKIALNYVLTNCDLPADVREKVEKMLAQVEKKNSADRKPTANQIANDGFKVAILNGMEDNRLYTISEMIKTIPEIADLTNQRVSAIVRQMVGTEIERIEDKRKAYFRKIAE